MGPITTNHHLITVVPLLLHFVIFPQFAFIHCPNLRSSSRRLLFLHSLPSRDPPPRLTAASYLQTRPRLSHSFYELYPPMKTPLLQILRFLDSVLISIL